MNPSIVAALLRSFLTLNTTLDDDRHRFFSPNQGPAWYVPTWGFRKPQFLEDLIYVWRIEIVRYIMYISGFKVFPEILIVHNSQNLDVYWNKEDYIQISSKISQGLKEGLFVDLFVSEKLKYIISHQSPNVPPEQYFRSAPQDLRKVRHGQRCHYQSLQD